MVKIKLYPDEDAGEIVENMQLTVEAAPRPGEKIAISESEYNEFTVISVEHLAGSGAFC